MFNPMHCGSFIRFLILKLDKNFDGIVCLSEKGKILPMNGIYRNSLKENLREELIKDNRKFVRFIEDNNFKFLKYEDWKKFDEKNIFENLNTIKELEEFKKKLLTIKKDWWRFKPSFLGFMKIHY